VNSKHYQETFLLQQHHTYQKSSYFKTAPSKKRAKISSFYQQFNNSIAICINKIINNIISTINIITRSLILKPATLIMEVQPTTELHHRPKITTSNIQTTFFTTFLTTK
jgi:hypothetical protein